MNKIPDNLPERVTSGAYGSKSYYEPYEGKNKESDALDPGQQLKDYWLILRERFWWFLACLLLVFTSTLVYTVNSTELYKSSVRVQVLRQQDTTTGFKNLVNDASIRNSEDFRTQVDIIKSLNIVTRIFNRLTDEERRVLMLPYERQFSIFGKKSPTEILQRNRRVSPSRGSLIVTIEYAHPDKGIAAKIANLFAQEYITYNMELRTEATQRAIEELRQQIDHESQKVAEIQRGIADFQREHDTVSVDPETNIDQQELLTLNQTASMDKRAVDELETQWQQIQKFRKQDRSLWELAFIIEVQQVAELLAEISRYEVEVATLRERYREKHPKMIRAIEALEQNRIELNQAVDSSIGTIYTNLERARENYKNSASRLAAKKQEIIDLQTLRVDWLRMTDSLKRTRSIHEYFKQRVMQLITENNDPREAARIVDRAYPSLRPFRPNIIFNLIMGLGAGCVLGVVACFLVAYLDDRVKTAFDIEQTLGFPIVGVLPRIPLADNATKAQVVINEGDKQAMEGFRTIHSVMKLSENRKKTRCLLTTSTIPGEGKSFVSTNMAFTHARGGEKTIIIDCDLRVPNLARSLSLQNEIGVIDFFDNGLPLEEITQREVYKNLDVIPSGGRIKNPNRLLNNEKFESLIDCLRVRYDTIIIDSPPLAPVSDALNILPFVDSVLYVIKFNTVRRRVVRSHISRIRELNIPVFVVLNSINLSLARYYYPQYYDSAYDGYYMDDETMGDGKIPIPAV